jgi:hypothetical protein
MTNRKSKYVVADERFRGTRGGITVLTAGLEVDSHVSVPYQCRISAVPDKETPSCILNRIVHTSGALNGRY